MSSRNSICKTRNTSFINGQAYILKYEEEYKGEDRNIQLVRANKFQINLNMTTCQKGGTRFANKASRENN